MAQNRPNILLILADDLGFSDLGCFGGEIDTPNIDELGMKGLRFTQCYNSARCCPSRASLLTGLYPHQTGVGHMTEDRDMPGYRGFLSAQCVTIAEVLRANGYQTYMSGKWHVGKSGPVERGFDEFYGMLGGFGSFRDENLYVRLPEDSSKRSYAESEFYATDAITEHALDFINESRNDQNPFFLYMAYNAPHFPLQADKRDIERYVQRYEKGWDKIRIDRLERLKQMNLVDSNTSLSPRAEYWDRDREISGVNPDWDSINPDRQKDLVRRMAIYAAMVDRMDYNVGRVIENLKAHNELDNTLIMFCSDNGACGEWDPWGFDDWQTTSNFLHRKADLEKMGGADTYHSYGSGWANACSTPLQLYKHYGHEGGISTPLIVHWPKVIERAGAIDHRPCHFIDFMSTFVDVTDSTYPKEFQGHETLPMEGQSLLGAFLGESSSPRTLCFEHEGHCAVRQGKWKLVKIKERDWELYDMSTDRVEQSNLAKDFPDKVNEMKTIWNEWALRTKVLPSFIPISE